MYRRLRKLGRRRPSDEDGSVGVDEEEEMSGTPTRRQSEQQDEYNSSSSMSDSYRFCLVGVRRLGECAGISEPDPAEMRRSIAQFMVELLQTLLESRSEPSSNVVFSPLATETTLALLYSIAAGASAEQIASAMHIQCPPQDLQKHVFRHAYARPSMFRPYFTLNNRIQLRARPPDDNTINELPSLAKAFDVDLKYVSFVEDAAGVRDRTNEWLHYLSAFECGVVFPERSVTDTSSMVLASLTYLRGDWKWQFRLQDTAPGTFRSSPHVPRTVAMMHQTGQFPMAELAEIDATALELKYRRRNKSMIIFLPRKLDGLALLEEKLTGDLLLRYLDELKDEREVAVSLPRFCAKQVIDMQDALSSMGIKDVFTGFADLSGIVGTKGYHVSQAMHCAVVCVKEKGQKLMTSEGGSEQLTEFAVDHPFMFCVVGRNPDAILLMGSVRQIQLPYI
ncbi:leukocyte elastase inhibitor-like [Dermacentor silvarum]|uniref:leukocyte elastase inhibitor-like n=1 Tax=Dermacentor silvarum TaxID=543639 RepID=UPI00210102F7|nr:leukocyte elastase inhibitor-like [Dermacentor silvarum]